jgi:predicted AlkP superfamily phosphohydrolase/phosphomutase
MDEKALRVLMIGLDSASWNILDPIVKDGTMKELGRLINRGVRATLMSTLPPQTFPAWPSIVTGVNPGKHGVFNFYKISENSYTLIPYSSYDVQVPFLWEILQDQGLKCGVINIPSSSPFRTYPLVGETDNFGIKKFINLNWKEDDLKNPLSSRHPKYLERSIEIVHQRFDQIEYMVNSTDLDFIIINIFVVDSVQHKFLQRIEKIRKFFQSLDERFGRLIRNLPSDAILFVFSDHGMSRTDCFFHINNWLNNKGLLDTDEAGNVITHTSAAILEKERKLINILAKLTHLSRPTEKLFEHLKFFAFEKNLSAQIGFEEMVKQHKINWSNTLAYAFGDRGIISLNLEGREAEGVVKQEEYLQTRAQIVEKLHQFFQYQGFNANVFCREEVYHGPYVEKAPDIIFTLNEGRISIKSSFLRTGDNLRRTFRIDTADHTIEGIFLAYGRNIKKGAILSEVNATDLVPTILHLFDLAIPTYIDGRVLTEIYESNSSFVNRTVSYSDLPPISPASKSQFEFGNDEKEEILERLRRLGYL